MFIRTVRMYKGNCTFDIYPKYLNRGDSANCVDPYEQFELGLHILPFHYFSLDTTSGSSKGLFNINPCHAE